MDYISRYNEWLDNLKDEDPLKKELLGIKGDEATVTREIEEYSKLGKNGLLNKIAGMKKNTTSGQLSTKESSGM